MDTIKKWTFSTSPFLIFYIFFGLTKTNKQTRPHRSNCCPTWVWLWLQIEESGSGWWLWYKGSCPVPSETRHLRVMSESVFNVIVVCVWVNSTAVSDILQRQLPGGLESQLLRWPRMRSNRGLWPRHNTPSPKGGETTFVDILEIVYCCTFLETLMFSMFCIHCAAVVFKFPKWGMNKGNIQFLRAPPGWLVLLLCQAYQQLLPLSHCYYNYS